MTRQGGDVGVVEKKRKKKEKTLTLTAAIVVPSTVFKVYAPPNSETRVSNESEFPSSKYDLRGHSWLMSD